MSEPTPSSQPAVHPYRWWMLFGVWMLYLCFGLTIANLAPLVPQITAELGLSRTEIGSVMGAWPLVYIAFAIPAGAALDRLGPRRALLIASLVIAASCALRGLATDYVTLFLAVALFGLGGPLISVGAPKLMSEWFEGAERGFAMGVYITGPQVGAIAVFSMTNSVMMPALGGWRTVLLAYGAFVLISTFAWFLISSHPASRAAEARMKAGPTQPALSTFGMLVQKREVQIVMLMSLCMFFYMHGLNNWLPEILRSGEMDAKTAGYWASVPTAIGIMGSLIIPRIATPERRFPILLALIACAGVAPLFLENPPGVLLAAALVLQGVVRGSLITIVLLTLVETRGVGARYAGAAGGLFFTAGELGGVVGPLTLGGVADWSGGFSASLLMLTSVCTLIGVLILILWRTTRLQGEASPPAEAASSA